MTKTALISKAVRAALDGDINTVEMCFDEANVMLLPGEEKLEVDLIIADCCLIADRVRG
jgi:hypothetical protein